MESEALALTMTIKVIHIKYADPGRIIRLLGSNSGIRVDEAMKVLTKDLLFT